MVNACDPGSIDTDMTRSMEQQGDASSQAEIQSPADGAVVPVELVSAEAHCSGRFYGSDGVRSPLHRPREPDSAPFSPAIPGQWLGEMKTTVIQINKAIRKDKEIPAVEVEVPPLTNGVLLDIYRIVVEDSSCNETPELVSRRLDEVLTALGYNGDNAAHTTEAVSQEESDEFFNLYDTDGSGAVDIGELVQMVAAFKERDSSTLNQTKIQEAWDADGDGSVTSAEFYERLQRAAETNPDLFSQFHAASIKKKAERLVSNGQEMYEHLVLDDKDELGGVERDEWLAQVLQEVQLEEFDI